MSGIIIDELDGIKTATAYGDFGEAFLKLKEEGYKDIISLSENAKLAIKYGEDIIEKGNWTREGVIYLPKRKPKIVRNSPFLESPERVDKAYEKRREFTYQLFEGDTFFVAGGINYLRGIKRR